MSDDKDKQIKELQDLLYLATTFKFIVPSTSRIAYIDIVRKDQPDHSHKWAIVDSGYTLNKLGEWEYQSLPSSRTDDYLDRNRYDTYQEAFEMVTNHFKKHPTGFAVTQ